VMEGTDYAFTSRNSVTLPPGPLHIFMLCSTVENIYHLLTNKQRLSSNGNVKFNVNT